jgi:hypothetical protein
VLAIDELVDHPAFERTGPVQRNGGDDVLEAVGTKAREQLAKARRFELEHPGRVAARDHLVDAGVVHRDRVDVERLVLAVQAAPS